MEFSTKKTATFPLNVTNFVRDLCLGIKFGPHHLHRKHLLETTFKGQYGQEE